MKNAEDLPVRVLGEDDEPNHLERTRRVPELAPTNITRRRRLFENHDHLSKSAVKKPVVVC